jgi:uncharacterized protein (DUF1800 family)
MCAGQAVLVADANRETIAWLLRRAGWGPAPGELDTRARDGVVTTIDRLVDPAGHGGARAPDPWANVDLTLPPLGRRSSQAARARVRERAREQAAEVIDAWLDHLVGATDPLVEWMAWFWHGHFVSGIDKVNDPALMVQQLRTYRSLALAPFPQLVRAATVDPAMLVYLDGATSTGTNPNENYGRELLELFTLGIGNFTENDVQAGAKALTGWTVSRRNNGKSQFVPGRHDDAPQSYLGVNGVHDVDSVVDAVTNHPQCPQFIAGKLARAILGTTVDPSLVNQFATEFSASGLDTRALVRSILQAGASGHGVEAVNEPVPWLVSAQRATGAQVSTARRIAGLRAAGQLPLHPPNVAGWPMGTTWFGASTVVARYDLASALAETTPKNNTALTAARAFDLDALADALGRPSGFSAPTRAALSQMKGDGGAVLALALASPDLAVA